MHKKITFLLIALAIICSPHAHANHYNDQQQTAHVVIGDTATIDNEMKPEEAENRAEVTFTRKTNKTSEETTLNKKENKQTIRGLFTLGGFDKDKDKIRISGKD
jgi:hypothetical protein